MPTNVARTDLPDVERALRVLLVAILVSAFVPGPQYPIGPADVILFDLLLLIAIPLFVVRLRSTGTLPVARVLSLYVAVGLYVGLAVLLPAAGVVVYRYPLGYVIGDVRWVQLVILGAILLGVYADSLPEFVADLERVIQIVIAINVLLLAVQLLNYLELADVSRLLEQWHLNRERFREYGYANGRFAGAHAYPSGLGLSAALGVAVLSRSVIADRRNVSFVMLSLFLVIASGHRTSMVAIAAILLLYVGYVYSYDAASAELVKYLARSALVIPPVVGLLYYLNIGQIATPDRYGELLDVLFRGATLRDVSGRGDRWAPALQRAEQYPFGTLANPAHVLGDLQAIDSYLVLAYVQGGVVFLLSYLGLLATLTVLGGRMVARTETALVLISLVLVVLAFSLMQNFATSLGGKTVLVLAIAIASLLYRTHGSVPEDDLLARYFQ